VSACARLWPCGDSTSRQRRRQRCVRKQRWGLGFRITLNPTTSTSTMLQTPPFHCPTEVLLRQGKNAFSDSDTTQAGTGWYGAKLRTVLGAVLQAGTAHVTSNYGTVYFVTTSPMVTSLPALPLLTTFAITSTNLLQDKVTLSKTRKGNGLTLLMQLQRLFARWPRGV
jgi:hypothetical protein